MKYSFCFLALFGFFILGGALPVSASLLSTSEINEVMEEKRVTAEEVFNDALYAEKNQQWDLAVHKYKRAIDLYPKLREAYLNVGNIFYDARRFEEAVHYYKGAINSDPHYFIAHMNLGLAYYGMGRYESAIQAFESGRLGMPNYVDGLYFMGRTYAHLDRPEDAVGVFEDLVSQNHEYYPAHFDLAHMYMSANQFKKALKHFEYVKEFAPNHEDIRHIETMIHRIQSLDLTKPENIDRVAAA